MGLLTISKMEIILGNQILNIELNIFKKPNLKRLTKELSDYFSENKIEGKEIKEFELEKEVFSNVIIPKKPYFEGCLFGGDYEADLAKIGEKYGIKDLGFAHWCYGK